MGRIRERGGGPGGVLVFWGGLQFFLGHFHGMFNKSSESSAQSYSIAILFEQIG